MKKKPICESKRRELQEMLDDGYTYKEMASYMDVCTDTLKRILVREGLAEFDGAKYAISPTHKSQVETWTRPCMKCKTEEPRPKWQYICDKCKAVNERYSSGLGDDWIFVDDGGIDV